MNKDDEMVWVFPACALAEMRSLPGVTKDFNDWEMMVTEVLPQCRFMRRGDVEDDPSMQQVIPYVVVRWKDTVLVYNRGSKGGEKRLADNWSIGVGGHINPEDTEGIDPVTEKNAGDVLRKAAGRELAEELTKAQVLCQTPRFHFLGLLQSMDTPVDEVHFGVILETRLSDMREVEETEELMMHKFVTVDELKTYELESWSEKVRDNLLK